MEFIITFTPVMQIFSFVGFALVVVLATILIYLKKPLGHLLPVLLWGVHGLWFYGFLLITSPPLDPLIFTWGSLLRFHVLLVILLILLVEIYKEIGPTVLIKLKKIKEFFIKKG